MTRELDFIYVGAPKSGSTWLFEALRDHPEAYLLPSKSSGFFETDTPGSLEDYRALLARGEGAARIGEIAHDAYLYRETAARLREAFPQVRVIACLREPGDFAESTLKWWSTHTGRFGSEVEQMARDPQFRQRMDYAACLEPFFAAFPAEQLKIMFFDELVSDPARFYREICAFIDVNPAFEPTMLKSVVNHARPPRLPALTRAVYELGGVGRRLGLGKLVEQAKRAPVIDALLYSGNSSQTAPAITKAASRERELARPGLASLERLIGRKVPPQWREATQR